MVTEFYEIFLDDKPCQNDSSVIRFLDCFCVCHLGLVLEIHSIQNVGSPNSIFTWLVTLRNLHCLEIFCVRNGAVVYFGRYLISWECFSFQISPKIHCTVFEELHNFFFIVCIIHENLFCTILYAGACD